MTFWNDSFTLTALVITACSPAPSAATLPSLPPGAFPASTLPASTPTTALATLAPPRSASELNARLLDLFARAPGASGLSREAIEQRLGMHLEVHPTRPYEFGSTLKLDDVWTFSLELMGNDKTQDKRLQLTFSAGDNPDMHAVCTPDLEGFTKQLTEVGYQSSKEYGEHGRFISTLFARASGKERIQVQLYPRGENDAHAQHLCVQMMIIDAQ